MKDAVKKITCLTAALAMALSLCACQGPNPGNTPDPGKVPETTTEPPAKLPGNMVAPPPTGAPDEGEEEVNQGIGDRVDPRPENPLPPIGLSAQECAEALWKMGILSADADENGDPVFGLEKSLTREKAVKLIAGTLGYDREGVDLDFPHPFTDVSAAASGAVGYAFRAGITGGTSLNTFSAGEYVTRWQMTVFLLRALGLGYNVEQPMERAVTLGLVDAVPEGPDEPVTLGEAVDMVVRFLRTSREGSPVTNLARLVEAGLVSPELVNEVGLSSLLSDVPAGTLPAAEIYEKFASAVVLVSGKDIFLKELYACHGTAVADGVVAVPMEAIRGAMYITVTDSAGKSFDCTGVLGFDADAGIVYLKCGAAAGDFGDMATPLAELPEEPDDVPAAVYAVSDSAKLFTDDHIFALPGLPVADTTGHYLGISTLRGVEMPTIDPGWTGMDLYDYCRETSPELLPPVKPRGIDPTKPMTAVTYDDGPHKTLTPKFLDLLEKYGVVATFFEVGTRLKEHPEFLQRMEDMGCEIGNHTYDHKYFSKLTAQQIYDEVESTNAIIESVLGHGAALVRCPGGITPKAAKDTLEYPLIYWTVDTRDWESRNAEKVIKHVKNAKLDGAIILMHSIHASTYEASLTIIPYILASGVQMVTVSELAFFRGVELENGVSYVRFPANASAPVTLK